MCPYGRIGITWGSEQGLPVRIRICNKVSKIKWFDDAINKIASEYQFRRVIVGVQERIYHDY